MFCLVLIPFMSLAQDLNESLVRGLAMRNIGPAFASGRISDIAVHPDNDNVWYVAVSSGGVWKTVNGGTTWNSIFDGQGSFATGCVTIDPNNPSTIWVGTGENVGGRHIAFGDGVYVSYDEGRSWKNMGLKTSEHISKIIVHPDNSKVIWVASQGPLWSAGGERGLYKSTDGGQTWKRTLGGGDWTGVTDLLIDPRNPQRLYAATWDRHRTVASYMGGGPGSGIHISNDGGETWNKLSSGIPRSNLGKIGLAMSYYNPDVIYAAIELDRTTGGVFMSENRGATWKKMSDAVSGATGPHYYQELYTSPHKDGRLYLMDNTIQISEDHGKTFTRFQNRGKHSDNHSINFRTDDPGYLLIGTDGGIYETFDHGQTFRFVDNLPITQYYKVAVDDAEPFYFVYGGTQDNGSHGGPSRTDSRHGIRNAEWFKTLGADGHQSATEPGNPNIMYAETQQGGLHRVDRISGEQVFIQPQAREGEPYERFNWDAPILVSPHNPARLYFASQRVWKSENRGDSWTPISTDLTRNQERFNLPIMGKQQSWDNAWDVNAMSNYNTITSLSESPKQEGLLYAGTDDGIIQVSENGGVSWTKVELGSIKGIPATAFVNDVRADLFDANIVYAALDNHKYGDYKPYLIKSTNKGRSWTVMSGDLPDRHLCWRLVQDHERQGLIFAATEFGIFFTLNGGTNWTKLTGGVPTISFRDITIQRRESDLVGASFGRSFFILDDITPLRETTNDILARDAHIFTVEDALWYVPRTLVSSQGEAYYSAPNPEFGATFTYYLKDGLKSLKDMRKEKERAMKDQNIPFPGWEALEKEMEQKRPKIVLIVKDSDGNIIRQVNGKSGKGIHRVNWDLRSSSQGGIIPGASGGRGGWFGNAGFSVVPGDYTVTLAKVEDGNVTELAGPQPFKVIPLREKGALEGAGYDEIIAFKGTLEEFQREMAVVNDMLRTAGQRISAYERAIGSVSENYSGLMKSVHDARMSYEALDDRMNGSDARNEVGEKNNPTPGSYMFLGFRALNTTYGPTPMHKEALETGRKLMSSIKTDVEGFMGVLDNLEGQLRSAGAPILEKN